MTACCGPGRDRRLVPDALKSRAGRERTAAIPAQASLAGMWIRYSKAAHGTRRRAAAWQNGGQSRGGGGSRWAALSKAQKNPGQRAAQEASPYANTRNAQKSPRGAGPDTWPRPIRRDAHILGGWRVQLARRAFPFSGPRGRAGARRARRGRGRGGGRGCAKPRRTPSG